MNEQRGIVALVPMRHESERVPGKNFRSFAGRPLFHHIIEALLEAECFQRVVVDTDSPVVISGVREHFPDVSVIERPDHLRDGRISMNDVLIHTTSRVDAHYFLQTHSTNPLLKPGTIRRAVETFFSTLPDHDSLFSVSRIQARLWTEEGTPLNHDPDRLLRTQDLAPVYQENSCIYIFDRDTLQRRVNRIGECPIYFELDSIESWDIDDEMDFRVAELLYINRERLVRDRG